MCHFSKFCNSDLTKQISTKCLCFYSIFKIVDTVRNVHVFKPFLSFPFSVKLVEAKDDCVIIFVIPSSFPYFPQVKSLLMAMLNWLQWVQWISNWLDLWFLKRNIRFLVLQMKWNVLVKPWKHKPWIYFLVAGYLS